MKQVALRRGFCEEGADIAGAVGADLDEKLAAFCGHVYVCAYFFQPLQRFFIWMAVAVVDSGGDNGGLRTDGIKELLSGRVFRTMMRDL